MLLHMHPILRAVYFVDAIEHCTSADAVLHTTAVISTPMVTLNMWWGEHQTAATFVAQFTGILTIILVRMQRQWRRAHAWRRHFAFAMGAHPRLGRASLLYRIHSELLRLVGHLYVKAL